ncbi:MAG: AAA family ATPase [Kofleriaceae bacterium]
MTALPSFEIYLGDGSTRDGGVPDPLPPIARETGRYLADPELKDAVNIAIAVGQPLLVTGEPGTGKTQLAFSVAEELWNTKPLVFHTRSTSTARDLLYRYDAVLRFNDIQANTTSTTGARKADDASGYIDYEALGQAILDGKQGVRRVVLIDEIDKAPRDFPNDLLFELEELKFRVPEIGPEVHAAEKNCNPIVIITSNSERQLPLPFLRRCIFHHIEFPDATRLRAIVEQRLGPLNLDGDLISVAVERFLEMRDVPNLDKKPATSELLTWLQALAIGAVNATTLKAASLGRLPFRQSLIKSVRDLRMLSPVT